MFENEDELNEEDELNLEHEEEYGKKKASKLAVSRKAKSRQTSLSTDYFSKAREKFEKQLCDEIDHKLSLISVIDAVLTESDFSLSKSDSEASIQVDKHEFEIKNCLADLVDTLVDRFESTYEQTPNTNLELLASFQTNANDVSSFKFTIQSLNMQKVISIKFFLFQNKSELNK